MRWGVGMIGTAITFCVAAVVIYVTVVAVILYKDAPRVRRIGVFSSLGAIVVWLAGVAPFVGWAADVAYRHVFWGEVVMAAGALGTGVLLVGLPVVVVQHARSRTR